LYHHFIQALLRYVTRVEAFFALCALDDLIAYIGDGVGRIQAWQSTEEALDEVWPVCKSKMSRDNPSGTQF